MSTSDHSIFTTGYQTGNGYISIIVNGTVPTSQPTNRPSSQPTRQPTELPTAQPTAQPSKQPSVQPSVRPTIQPSSQPSCRPTDQPTNQPSSQPSSQPSTQPSNQPTEQPTMQPSAQPYSRPSVQPTEQPSATPTSQPSSQPSGQPSVLPTNQPSSQPTSQPTMQPSNQPTEQPTMQPSAQPYSRPSVQPTEQPSATPTSQPSSQPSGQPSVLPTNQPSSQPTSQPTMQPSGQPTEQPTMQPSTQPSSRPSVQPTNQPSSQPTSQPTMQPSGQPTEQPTMQPSTQPSRRPSVQPTNQPTTLPTIQPSEQPTVQPSVQPSSQPTSQPTMQPSSQPTEQPSTYPTAQPSGQPSVQPSNQPTTPPTIQPSGQPTVQPSMQPSSQPTRQPSSKPSSQPTSVPSFQPTCRPSVQPSCQPTNQPSGQPSAVPSRQPSSQPSTLPTDQPTVQPSSQPSIQPSSTPSSQPSFQPSTQPSSRPSVQPSSQPSGQPTVQPTTIPSSQPTVQPTTRPTTQPSLQPSAQPTLQPFSEPSGQPTNQPSSRPTDQPSTQPSLQPTEKPSTQPSSRPSIQPSAQPSHQPSDQPTREPSNQPSSVPSAQPSCFPSSHPSDQPTFQPSGQPTSQPLTLPTSQPSNLPTSQPSNPPTSQPSNQPSSSPSLQPLSRPSAQPSDQPTREPSNQPSSMPSSQPLSEPTVQPASIPTTQPSTQPTRRPSTVPSGQPSKSPTVQPISKPSMQPSSNPSAQPSSQPSLHPSTQPTCQPSSRPTSQPTNQPSEQPSTKPSSQPSAQPQALPTSTPSNQPTNTPTCQPSETPSSQPSSQPTKNRMNCLASEDKFYSSIKDDCIPCPYHSFLNQTGDETCYCNAGYSQTGFGLSLNCTLCPPGEMSLSGSRNCTECPTGSFADTILTHTCVLCPVSFYSSSRGQTQCHACPAGRSTAVLGAISALQCVSPIPNFTLGFFALFFVVVIFSYIVFGKFHRLSFERRVKTVIPNIEKCKQVLVHEEELHYQHLKCVQEKRNRQNRKFKFISFVLISFLLIIVSVLASFIYFTYQVFFTSLILWRGMKADFQLGPILNLLTEALRGITQYVGFPVDVVFIIAIPFLYLFEALGSISLNLSSVNITCSGSQAPIELLINCFILGFLIIVVRSDYQLLFNVVLNNVNHRFLLNDLEQHLDRGSVWFSRYFFVGIIFTVFIMINPLQVGLRYCMGFVRLDTFGKNHYVSHEVSQACDKVAGARYFDSFLGYTSTIFAWWLILPAVYCLAEVVVPKCRKSDPLKMIDVKSMSKKGLSKILPAELCIDENTCSKKVAKELSDCTKEKDEENGLQLPEKVANEKTVSEDIGTAEFPSDLSAKFPGTHEKALVGAYQRGLREGLKEGVKIGKIQESMKYSNNSFVHVEEKFMEQTIEEKSNYVRKSIQNVTKKMPFLLAFYFYCKEKYFLLISIDLWISNTFAFWINCLQKNASKNVPKDRLEDTKHTSEIAKPPCAKRLGMKQLLSLDSERFIQYMHVYDQAQVAKQRKLDNLWQQEHYLNNHTLPSYYELSYAVQEELHEFVIQPFSSCLAFIGIGHFFTPTGRSYWNVVFHNYKVFLLVCLGIWTDEAVEAYDLIETTARLSVDDRAFLEQEQEIIQKPVLLAPPTGRRFSAQILGFTITQAASNSTGARGHHHPQNESKDKQRKRLDINKKNVSEVLPAIISVLICSRVILFQIVPSLVLFATISMTLASFPLFIFSEFLAETLPPLIVWGETSRQMSVERELKSFSPSNSETKQVLSEQETVRVLTEEYSWRLSLRGTILFWNESRLLQFVHSSLALFFSFLLLIYNPDLLVYLVIILALLTPFILSKSLVLLLYLGNSLDVKDIDFPSSLRQNNLKRNTTPRIKPSIDEQVESNDNVIVAEIEACMSASEMEDNSFQTETTVHEIPVYPAERLPSLSETSSDCYNSHDDDDENSVSDSDDGTTASFSSIDLDADIENSWVVLSSTTEEE
jgi:ABC-type multidrug transport system fused ATPase/permease subunit